MIDFREAQTLALDLFDVGVFLTRDSVHPLVISRGNERGFLLTIHDTEPDWPLSPVYLTLRTDDNPTKPGPLTTKLVERAARCMAQVASYHELDFDAVCGVPNAGEPFARAFAEIARCELAPLVKQLVSGSRQITAGPDTGTGRRVLLTDDLISTGKIKLLAAQALRKANNTVEDLVVLIDREQGGVKEVQENGLTTHAVYKFRSLLDFYVQEKRITPELRAEIKTYLAANG